MEDQTITAEAACAAASVEVSVANLKIAQYLLERSPEYLKVSVIRKKRQQADHVPEESRRFFYKMMQDIAREIDSQTGAFACLTWRKTDCSILDLGTAPGGFLKYALDRNSSASAVGYTLPVSEGGHEVLVPDDERVVIKELDMTMLAEDMGMDIDAIPEYHADAGAFLPRELADDDLFDLVICDGQVLRTHTRAAYREKREATRLSMSRLALALGHVKVGGKMIILRHKLEAWHVVSFIHELSQIAKVQLHKPRKAHASRSSFYIVATNVQADQPKAKHMVKEMKRMWQVATFGTDDEYTEAVQSDETAVEEVLLEFGPRLLQLGKKVWETQEAALSRANFNRAK